MSGDKEKALEELDDVIASGVSNVETNGRKVTYRGLDSLFKARQFLNDDKGSDGGIRTSVARFDDGF